jgi:hypothetical protein
MTKICVEHNGEFDDNDGKDICKTCEDWLSVPEKCAICELDDYHDSEQYICDDCHNELEALKADQLASAWD